MFETDLSALKNLSVQWMNAENRLRLEELQTVFTEWSVLPKQLFELHDSPRKNQPALRMAYLEIQPLRDAILDTVNTLMHIQQQELSAEMNTLLRAITDFRASFEIMVMGLRAYAGNGDLTMRFTYASNLTQNTAALKILQEHQYLLNGEQQTGLTRLMQAREHLLAVVPEIFETVQGEHAYADMYLFRTEAVPYANRMLRLLDDMTTDQQAELQADLSQGRQQRR